MIVEDVRIDAFGTDHFRELFHMTHDTETGEVKITFAKGFRFDNERKVKRGEEWISEWMNDLLAIRDFVNEPPAA